MNVIMNLKFTTIFVAALQVSVVNAVCIHINPGTVDFDALCLKWWDEAAQSQKASSVARCVTLIKRKCPHLITVDSETTRHYDGKSSRHEIWWTRVTASLNSDPSSTIYYKEHQDKPICSDDGGEKDCDYWWSVVKMVPADDTGKQVCVDRILSHCPGMIKKVGESFVCDRCRGRYDVKLVTYQKGEGDRVSFNTYGPI